jgi:hypothetical protein
MNATEKMLIQKILESEMEIDDKLAILVEAGIPLGAEYTFTVSVNAEKVGTKWLDRLTSTLFNDPEIISFSVDAIKEKELGDDEWKCKKWDISNIKSAAKAASITPSNRKFITTGQAGTGRWGGTPRPVNLHITDDSKTTLCGRHAAGNWKVKPFDVSNINYNGKNAKVCGSCATIANSSQASATIVP